MGWETRRGGRYYYQSRRVNGRVVKQYVGGGRLGEIAAYFDERAREDRDWQAHQQRAARAEDEALAGLVDEFDALVGTLTAAALLTAGYHRPDRKRRWRKRRGEGVGDGGRHDQRLAAEGE